MKIGIFQEALRRCGSFEKQIGKLAAHGFEAMDFSDLMSYKSPLYLLSPSEFETTLREYEKIAREGGVEVSQVHAPFSYPQVDNTPELAAKKLELTYKAIEGTALLGCRRLVVHPIYPHTSHDLNWAEETWAANRTFLQRLCDRARAYNVLICLENMPSLRFSIPMVWDVLRLVKEVGDPQLRICLDTGHCAVFEYSPAKAARLIGGELLQALHIHDNNGKEDQHRLPYDGIIDWEDFARALHEVGFDGALSLETGAHNRLPEPLFDDYLRHVYRRIAYIAAMAK